MIRTFLCLGLLAMPATSQITTRASVTSNGVEFGSHTSHGQLSADGRWAAFVNKQAIYLHDRKLGTSEVVSVDPNGVPIPEAYYDSEVSKDGRYVVFASDSPDFVSNDQNAASDIFRRDMLTGTTELVSLTFQGVQIAGGCGTPKLSADGSRVFFLSWANGIVPGDYNGWIDLFVRDLNTQTNYQVNVDSNGVPALPVTVFNGKQATWAGHGISADGRYAVFTSKAPDLVPNDTNDQYDVFVHDLATRTTERVSLAWDGSEAQEGGGAGSISGDGRYVAFISASSLVPGDTNGVPDVFVRDRVLGTTLRVNVDSLGMESTGVVIYPFMAPERPLVLFGSDAPDLVSNDTNGAFDVFLHDFQLGTTIRVSVDSAGNEVQEDTTPVGISTNGRFVGLASTDGKLVLRDKNGKADFFVRDLQLSCPPIEAFCTAKTNSKNCKPKITASGSPSASGETAFFVVGYQFLPNKLGLFFWGLTPKSTPFQGGTLCVQGPLKRTPVQDSGGNSANNKCIEEYSFSFDAAYMAKHGLSAGDTVYGQYWAYDSAPLRTSLSDGLQFTICP